MRSQYSKQSPIILRDSGVNKTVALITISVATHVKLHLILFLDKQ